MMLLNSKVQTHNYKDLFSKIPNLMNQIQKILTDLNNIS